MLTPIEDPLVSFIVPIHNEERSLDELMNRLLDLDMRTQIVLIDDGSKDDSHPIAERWAAEHEPVEVIVRERNKGTGAAARSGFAAAAALIRFRFTD